MTMIIKRTTELNVVADFVATAILRELKLGKRVLWFVTGGSSVPVAVEAAKIISQEPHSNLSVTLTDERYVPVGHPDSNWQELIEKGFKLPEAKMIPVLAGANRATTTENFNTMLERELKIAQYKIGLFGIGADGHTAGILPESKALTSRELAYDYNTDNFERITITPKVIVQLDEIIAFTKGEDKWEAIENLGHEMDISKQPAQILKQVPIFTIFTDYQKE